MIVNSKVLFLGKLYILKRIIARLIVYIISFLNKLPFLNVFLNRFFSNMMDVEGVFYKLNVEREIENIIFINSLIKKNYINYLVDIGGNYGQFSSSINLPSTSKFIFEPNKKLIHYIKKSNTNSSIFNSGVVCKNGNYFLVDVPGNSGASYLSESKNNFNQKISTISVSNLVKNLSKNICFKKTLIKIDIEGGEVDLINEFNSLNNSSNFIYAFECLKRKEIVRVNKILKNHSLFSLRFNYQGNNDKNYSSLGSVLKVFLSGRDTLNIFELTPSSLNRDFYSLVFCIPKTDAHLMNDLL